MICAEQAALRWLIGFTFINQELNQSLIFWWPIGFKVQISRKTTSFTREKWHFFNSSTYGSHSLPKRAANNSCPLPFQPSLRHPPSNPTSGTRCWRPYWQLLAPNVNELQESATFHLIKEIVILANYLFFLCVLFFNIQLFYLVASIKISNIPFLFFISLLFYLSILSSVLKLHFFTELSG